MKISYNGRYVQVMPLTPKIEPKSNIIAGENKILPPEKTLAGKNRRGRPTTRQETIDK